jgi:hypothetical protein
MNWRNHKYGLIFCFSNNFINFIVAFMNKFYILIVFLLIWAVDITAQNVGNGSWGNYTYNSGHYTDNTRAKIVNIDDSDPTFDLVELDVTHNYVDPSFPWTQFVGGSTDRNRVLIMNMAQSQTPAPNRNYQITQILGIFTQPPPPFGTGAITLKVNKFTKINWCLMGTSTCQLQAVLVPQYRSLTLNSGARITCHPWDGQTGGVSCFLVEKTLTVNTGAWVDAAKCGFINPNNNGLGGTGAITGGVIPAGNPPIFPHPGINGNFVGPDYRPLGQPVASIPMACNPLPSENGGMGGTGGTGGYAAIGVLGYPGAAPQTRLNHAGISPPNRVFLGKAGAQGTGGQSGGTGGSGGNGGNGGDPGFPGLSGIGGNGGSNGGNGGYGGKGGGAIIVLATDIVVNATGQWVDLSAENGFNAQVLPTPMSGYSNGGHGGMGGDALCIGAGLIGYGAGGIKGQRGDGAAGGQGGSGGSIGSSSIRASNSNQFNKITHVKKVNGLRGFGAIGEPAPPLTATNGADGYPVICPGINLCEKHTYTVYDCACNEAYRVLAEMDEAIEYTNYIEFQNTGKFSLPYIDKKNGITITVNPGSRDIQYCYYYKNTQLLIAFERNINTPITVSRPVRGGAPTIDVYNEYSYNVFWCKLNSMDLINCNNIHSDAGTNINAYPSLFYIAPNSLVLSTLPKTNSFGTLNYDYGWVEFNGIAPVTNKYKYEDYLPYPNEQGELYEIVNPGNSCRKGCLPFEMEWVYPQGYLPGNSGGGQGGGGNPGEYPILPYMDELWDVVADGKTGGDGDDGEGGNDNSDDGGFPPGGGDDEGNLMNINDINQENTNFALYPNPTGKFAYIGLKGKMEGEVSISLIDVNGKVVQSKEQIDLSAHAYQLNLEGLPSGIYLVRITNSKGLSTLRLVKE